MEAPRLSSTLLELYESRHPARPLPAHLSSALRTITALEDREETSFSSLEEGNAAISLMRAIGKLLVGERQFARGVEIYLRDAIPQLTELEAERDRLEGVTIDYNERTGAPRYYFNDFNFGAEQLPLTLKMAHLFIFNETLGVLQVLPAKREEFREEMLALDPDALGPEFAAVHRFLTWEKRRIELYKQIDAIRDKWLAHFTAIVGYLYLTPDVPDPLPQFKAEHVTESFRDRYRELADELKPAFELVAPCMRDHIHSRNVGMTQPRFLDETESMITGFENLRRRYAAQYREWAPIADRIYALFVPLNEKLKRCLLKNQLEVAQMKRKCMQGKRSEFKPVHHFGDCISDMSTPLMDLHPVSLTKYPPSLKEFTSLLSFDEVVSGASAGAGGRSVAPRGPARPKKGKKKGKGASSKPKGKARAILTSGGAALSSSDAKAPTSSLVASGGAGEAAPTVQLPSEPTLSFGEIVEQFRSHPNPIAQIHPRVETFTEGFPEVPARTFANKHLPIEIASFAASHYVVRSAKYSDHAQTDYILGKIGGRLGTFEIAYDTRDGTLYHFAFKDREYSEALQMCWTDVECAAHEPLPSEARESSKSYHSLHEAPKGGVSLGIDCFNTLTFERACYKWQLFLPENSPYTVPKGK